MTKPHREDQPRSDQRAHNPEPERPKPGPSPAGGDAATTGVVKGDAPPAESATGTAMETDPVDLSEVIEREREAIREWRTRLAPLQPKKRLHPDKFHATALSLSGGGIRSACFNLGLLEGLDRLGREPKSVRPCDDRRSPGGVRPSRNFLELFDYASSVSGGSYAAGHLATAMLDQDPDDASKNGSGWARSS